MTIKILPPQLANQIAAGEVVERPASVVKELVENALDAGATKVDIEIERGGHKRILIRDNGKGVDKQQLALALSRHATSKIANIDDLEAIVSLGFRGEALASISSVSRLTMTSKPAAQKEAWSASAEGLTMDVEIKPAAHPDGTTVDVVDLFFNTPARRKFLRAEKTEFSHIETLIKRIALSRPDVHFILKHNQKVIKKYRAQSIDLGVVEQKSKRISEVINQRFIDSSSVFTSQYDQVNIAVWVKAPEQCVGVNPAQYSFVNGRMMRDKLIQHAIRQAYGQLLNAEQLPEYVVFIELPASEVDVNVHPAKHEVRFHHARLLHDLIVRTIKDALDSFEPANQQIDWSNKQIDQESGELIDVHKQQQKPEHQQPIEQTASTPLVSKPTWIAEPNQDYQAAPTQPQTGIEKTPLKSTETFANKPKALNRHLHHPEYRENIRPVTQPQLDDAVNNLGVSQDKFQTNPQAKPTSLSISDTAKSQMSSATPNEQQVNEVSGVSFSVMLVKQLTYAYCQFGQDTWLVDAQALRNHNTPESSRSQGALDNNKNLSKALNKTPLLVPVRLRLSEDEAQWCKSNVERLTQHGFELLLHQAFLIVKQVPAILRTNENSQTIPMFFDQLMLKQISDDELIEQILSQQSSWRESKEVVDFLQHIAKQPNFEAKLKQCAVKLDESVLLQQLIDNKTY